ncbi:MAG: UDP-galactopyranose mutase [Syntrophomonas sp.]|nr:UDP-galactopyranose mutase [Syntrophomonas sp.]
MYNYLIVGAGIAGCVLAERLANFGNHILIVEKRYHVGGNCYDEYNQDGILIHRYGPHIFRTNSQEIWKYLSHFTDWYHYQHKVLAYVDGLKVPFPVNLDTLNILLNQQFSGAEMKNYLDKVRYEANVDVEQIKNGRDMAISLVGQELYDKLFKYYTRKQWNLWPEELAAEVTGRIPVRLNRDSRYFNDKYQGLPKHGYTKMFNRMLEHPNIHILLKTDYKQIIESISFDRMIYTGPIDYFFNYVHGRLPYRSLKFEYETLPVEYYQEVGTVNYPNDYDFTRITEYKHLTGQKHLWSTIAREYPATEGEPYYPVPTEVNQELYSKYESEAQKLKSVYFLGRLAEYRYYSMDQVISQVFRFLSNIT